MYSIVGEPFKLSSGASLTENVRCFSN